VPDRWFDFFWVTPLQGVPASVAFGLYSPTHVAILAVLFTGIACTVWAYRRGDERRRRRIRLVLGIGVIASEASRQIAYLSLGPYDPSLIPLHMCGAATFCVFVDALRPNSWTREFLYALGTWGAAAAILFPDWANMPWFNFFTWQSFLIHACILAYALCFLVSREFTPRAVNLWKVVVMMAVIAPVVVVVNATLGTNFWYLNTGSPGSPLAPIQAATGPAYIPALLVLLAILWFVMYLPWELVRRRAARRLAVATAPR